MAPEPKVFSQIGGNFRARAGPKHLAKNLAKVLTTRRRLDYCPRDLNVFGSSTRASQGRLLLNQFHRLAPRYLRWQTNSFMDSARVLGS